jgi:hypothetical protein
MAAACLHTLHDGSTLVVMKAKELIGVPVWQGNRIIDSAHVARIRAAVGDGISALDFGYRLVRCPVVDGGGATVWTMYLVDGQHRHAVLREYFASELFAADFDVVVIVKEVGTEMEIIEYFNTLNTVKPILWSDPNLVVNLYIQGLEAEFNKGKAMFLRKGATCRPYLSVDKLRERLTARVGRLAPSRTAVAAFVARVREWNAEGVRRADVDLLGLPEKEAERLGKAAKLGFVLAHDVRLPWIEACLD